MIKILLLEDDDTISFGIEAALKRKGYDCITCPSIEQGRKLFSSDIRLILLDLNLPDGSGYDFCRWVKEQADTPIIFLTVRDGVMDITRGLDMGADDYITKPFLPQELLLRLNAVLRRVYRETPDTGRLGDVEIDWGKSNLRRCGVETALTAKEFTLLKKLWDARGNIVTIDALCAALWDGPLVGYENTLMVHIRRLREKIEADPSHPQYLLTVRGLGYRLNREETK